MERMKTQCNYINLRRATNALTKYYDNKIKSCGITSNQLSILKNIDRIGICNVTKLSNHMGLERTTLVRNLRPLFKKGFVEDISFTEKRSCQLKITSVGCKVLEDGMLLWKEAQNGIDRKLGKNNVALLTNLLSLIETI